MKTLKITVMALVAVIAGISITSCSDANEYKDNKTANPSWVDKYTDSTAINHPETLANTKWVRGSGLKKNVYGEEIQGFVESLDFVSADSVAVKMSEGVTAGTWTDESNTEDLPYYEYTYSAVTGTLQVLKETVNDKGAVTKTPIFTGVAVDGTKSVLTVVHFGDTPIQTYMVKQ